MDTQPHFLAKALLYLVLPYLSWRHWIHCIHYVLFDLHCGNQR